VTADGAVLWYLNRATGLVSLVLMTLTIVLGVLVQRQRRLPGLPRFGVVGLHRNVALLSAVLLVVHVLTAVADSYVDIGLLTAVVPFVSGYRPFWVGLGTVAVDLVAVLLVTSLLRGRIPARLWRGVHWTSYALWPLAFAHGLGAGTDVGSGWALTLSGVCAVAVAVAVTDAVAGRLRARPASDRAPAALAATSAALSAGRPAAVFRNR
jgi:sulfoxide reductase heme-binding subunit YedZ